MTKDVLKCIHIKYQAQFEQFKKIDTRTFDFLVKYM